MSLLSDENIIKPTSGQIIFFKTRKRHTEITEDDLIRLIVSNFKLFGLLMLCVFGDIFASLKRGDGLYVAPLVPRQAFGLESKGKPGDVDLLIVPYHGTCIDVANAIAIEVKVCRPTQEKPSKSPDTTGHRP